MATLTSPTLHLAILPLRIEFEESPPWVCTELGLELRIPPQSIRLVSDAHTIRYEDFRRLIAGSKTFIDDVEAIPPSAPLPKRGVKPFFFMPMETDIQLEYLAGSPSYEDGYVELRIMLNLQYVVPGWSSEYVGVSTTVSIEELQQFLDTLEKELAAIVPPNR